MLDDLLRKYLVTSPKLKILYGKCCLSKKEVFKKLSVQSMGGMGPVTGQVRVITRHYKFTSTSCCSLVLILRIIDLTHSHSEFLCKVSSATFILFKITWELSESSQNI